ncbi:MAG: Gfo/Idh/MocA family oxidoreductase [Rhizobiaceae bacterium]|nr:Gfo/Idh/MocA family oxidoreductase [Rhizobiaceae bacterium]
MKVNVALVGAGFIGRSHALAIHAVNHVFPDCPVKARAFILAENTAERAQQAARMLNFEHATGDWQEAVDRADAVIVAVPSNLHSPIVQRAIAQKKPVLCEKPVGLSADEAGKLAELASEAGVVHAVGFTYTRLPLVRYAQGLIQSGKLGRVLHARGRHSEDYLADPAAPHNWRLSAATAGRYGALGDLGYHIIAILRVLCGPIAELTGNVSTLHAQRPSDGRLKAVENEDYACALIRFESGAVGSIETSRVALGRKMDVSFEIVCEGGTLVFDGERMNELRLYEAGQPVDGQGFRTILANASHPDYAGFLPAPGHQLGFNDLKTIELRAFLEGIAAGQPVAPHLGDAARISRICDAILDSSATGRRVSSPESYERAAT